MLGPAHADVRARPDVRGRAPRSGRPRGRRWIRAGEVSVPRDARTRVGRGARSSRRARALRARRAEASCDCAGRGVPNATCNDTSFRKRFRKPGKGVNCQIPLFGDGRGTGSSAYHVGRRLRRRRDDGRGARRRSLSFDRAGGRRGQRRPRGAGCCGGKDSGRAQRQAGAQGAAGEARAGSGGGQDSGGAPREAGAQGTRGEATGCAGGAARGIGCPRGSLDDGSRADGVRQVRCRRQRQARARRAPEGP